MNTKLKLLAPIVTSLAALVSSCSYYSNTNDSREYKMYNRAWGPSDSTSSIMVHEFKKTHIDNNTSSTCHITFYDLNNDGVMDQADSFMQNKSYLSDEINLCRYLRNKGQIPVESELFKQEKIYNLYIGEEAELFLDNEFGNLRSSHYKFR